MKKIFNEIMDIFLEDLKLVISILIFYMCSVLIIAVPDMMEPRNALVTDCFLLLAVIESYIQLRKMKEEYEAEGK